MLKLGWLYNILKDDREAVKWFNLASKSPDASISNEAGKASHNLASEFALFRTTVWIYPFFSTRWHDAFGYGQVKTELRLGKFPLHPYFDAIHRRHARYNRLDARQPRPAISFRDFLHFRAGPRKHTLARDDDVVRGR